MDEQDGQRSGQPETPSADGARNQKRANRRRNRRRRARPAEQVNESQTQATAETEPTNRERPRTGNAAKPKRRNAQPRKAMPEFTESTEVVRNSAPTIAALRPMRQHKIDPNDNSEPIIGCPMLTRTRLKIPFRGNQQVPRCSAGWAVHDEDEVLFCMHTPTAAQCWKEHPERVPELVEELRPLIEAELAASENAE